MKIVSRVVLTLISLAVVILSITPQNLNAQTPNAVYVNPSQLYRFRIPGRNLGYVLTTSYQEGVGNNWIYEKIMGGIFVGPSGYTPDPAWGLVPFHRWNVLQDGRSYTFYSTVYTPEGPDYTYQGIIGYVYYPFQTSAIVDPSKGLVTSFPLKQISSYYSQRYGYFQGSGAPGYNDYGIELPPNSSFSYQTIDAAIYPGALFGTAPSNISDPSGACRPVPGPPPSGCAQYSFNRGFGIVKFNLAQ